ncbi:hypothetical protein L3Q82_008218 [Scortum barcoo]|uniref:Uncharacterized protein n=1 Tax=Scortum barcoo TaxID=214431 RepID=A0ACB8WHG8_9TELE|nr:hypothetical protein L3Q82_008218 [Scortum barcoo]
MEFIEGSRGVYRPIRVMFDTPIYERALQTCWHMGSYKSQIALVTELLRLQQKNLLPSEVTAEDMTQFLVEESKSTLRVQLWEFELEDYDVDVRPLLRMVWEVNTSMKMRDVEFEARRLLTSPEAAPPQFQLSARHRQIYARSLTEQQQEACGPKQLSPREVVIEVVPPKVLQGFWLPPPNTHLNMPSQQLSRPVSRSIRDNLVLSIQEKVRQGHTREILVKKLNCFAAEVLNIITDVAAREICALFHPQTHSNIQPEVSEQVQQPTSAVVSPPLSPLIPFAEPPASIGFNVPAEQPTTGLEIKSVVIPAPPCPMTPPAEVVPSVLDTEHRSEESTKDQDSATNSAPPHLVSHPAEEPSSVLDTENNCVEPTKVEDLAVDPAPPCLVSPPAEVVPSVLDTEHRGKEPTREPDSDMDSAPPCPMSPPAEETPSVLDTENKCAKPTKVEESVVDSAPPCPVSPPAEEPPSVLDTENKCVEPTEVEDPAVHLAPPCPMSPPAEVTEPVLDTEHRIVEPTREPDCDMDGFSSSMSHEPSRLKNLLQSWILRINVSNPPKWKRLLWRSSSSLSYEPSS